MCKVLFVGGFDRLVSKYKKEASKLGCKLCHHCGRCQGGKEKLCRFITQADAVFCPLDVNSHTARKVVRESCRKQQKPAFFLPRSSVNEFKRALSKWLKTKGGHYESSHLPEA
ncbi:MAG: DUF2325 domain-containing protein [Candidatus Desulfofervidaceae bacterium]|nr:DUF2325 domain-containing protein [Candidatus Desulfofervidaceae bacterium]